MTSILFYITHAKSYYILQFKIKNIYLKNKKYFYDFLFVKLYLFVLDLVFKMSDLIGELKEFLIKAFGDVQFQIDIACQSLISKKKNKGIDCKVLEDRYIHKKKCMTKKLIFT